MEPTTTSRAPSGPRSDATSHLQITSYGHTLPDGQAIAMRWTPPPGVRDHGGGPPPEGSDFFAAPPATIGALGSAATTLRVGLPVGPGVGAVAVRLLLGALMGALAGWLLRAAVGLPWFVAALAVPAGAAFAWWTLRRAPDQVCTFVGEDGIAILGCKGSRERHTAPRVLRFADAARFDRVVKDPAEDPRESYVLYRMTWYDARGRTLHEESSGFAPGNRRAEQLYAFARAAERAWHARRPS